MPSPGSGHELYQPHLYEDPGPRSLVIHKIMAQVAGIRNFGKDLVNIMPSPGSGHELYQLHVYEDPRPSFLVIYKYITYLVYLVSYLGYCVLDISTLQD